jgi:hypothetical protein
MEGRKMITRDNFKDVLRLISKKDIKRIKKSDKEYIVLMLQVFNVGGYVSVILTNDYNRYKNVSYNGNCIFELNNEFINQLEGVK